MEIIALEGTIVVLVVRAWSVSSLASMLLVPYALWLAFATALTWGDLGAELTRRPFR